MFKQWGFFMAKYLQNRNDRMHYLQSVLNYCSSNSNKVWMSCFQVIMQLIVVENVIPEEDQEELIDWYKLAVKRTTDEKAKKMLQSIN